jgi:hypothetical protein
MITDRQTRPKPHRLSLFAHETARTSDYFYIAFTPAPTGPGHSQTGSRTGLTPLTRLHERPPHHSAFARFLDKHLIQLLKLLTRSTAALATVEQTAHPLTISSPAPLSPENCKSLPSSRLRIRPTHGTSAA